VFLERRPAPGIWGGLWSPPQFVSESEALAWCRRELGDSSVESALAPIEHGFTHFDLRLNPLHMRCPRPVTGIKDTGDRLWYLLHHPPKLGLPQPIARLFERLVAAASPLAPPA
jgi:A/G-specific adenine glycosylase